VKESQVKRWEYHAQMIGTPKLGTLLNSLGADGWELVSASPAEGATAGLLLLVLKRERSQRSQPDASS